MTLFVAEAALAESREKVAEVWARVSAPLEWLLLLLVVVWSELDDWEREMIEEKPAVKREPRQVQEELAGNLVETECKEFGVVVAQVAWQKSLRFDPWLVYNLVHCSNTSEACFVAIQAKLTPEEVEFLA